MQTRHEWGVAEAAAFALCALAQSATAAPAASASAASAPALADPVEVNGDRSHYVLGTALIWAPEYAGAGTQAFKLRPLLAYQYGRFRISTSRAGAVLGFGAGAPGPGATADLLKSDVWKLGAGLRIDGGRQTSDSPDLEGLPEIRRTLRGRFYTSYALSANWGAGATVSQDLLGREGGATASISLGYRDRLTERSEWSAGTGLSFGNARYMRTYFGISEASAQRTGLRAFEPASGVRDFSAGLGVTSELAASWIGFAGVGASHLLGDAAASPLTRRTTALTANVGIAYRCCK